MRVALGDPASASRIAAADGQRAGSFSSAQNHGVEPGRQPC
jgi:hypothetical protein